MKIKVRTSSLEKYFKVMLPDMSIAYCIAVTKDEATFEIDSKELEFLQKAYDKDVKKKKLETECSKFGTIGFAYEQRGKITEAIKQYEKMLELGCPETIYYERLLKIYRKGNDYINEKRVIKRLMKLFQNDIPERYKERLEKIKKKLNE